MQSSASASETAARLRDSLARAGLNALGVVDCAAWNACVREDQHAERLLRGARSALVVGSGGRALFSAFEASPEREWPVGPLDAYTERVLGEAAGQLRAAGLAAEVVLAHEPRGGGFVDFVALGRAAGLGWPSRLGLLLHPTFGPWMSLRAAILTDAALPADSPLGGSGPCEACPAPCAEACPGAALATGRFDAARCAATRHRELDCTARCGARRACVVGPEHGYSDRAEAHHMRASALAMGMLPPSDDPLC